MPMRVASLQMRFRSFQAGSRGVPCAKRGCRRCHMSCTFGVMLRSIQVSNPSACVMSAIVSAQARSRARRTLEGMLPISWPRKLEILLS